MNFDNEVSYNDHLISEYLKHCKKFRRKVHHKHMAMWMKRRIEKDLNNSLRNTLDNQSEIDQ